VLALRVNQAPRKVFRRDPRHSPTIVACRPVPSREVEDDDDRTNVRPVTRIGLPALATVAAAAVALRGVAHAHPAVLHAVVAAMPSGWMVSLGAAAGTAAGLLAGLIGIGGGIVVVPAIYYGLIASGLSADQAARVAISTSFATILPAAVVSSVGHWRAGNTDIAFLRSSPPALSRPTLDETEFLPSWGPAIVAGVVAAQLAAPHLRGNLMTGAFALLCLVFATRFAFPSRIRQFTHPLSGGLFRTAAGVSVGLFSGLAGVGGGIMTNIVMRLSGLTMHQCVGRAAAVGGVVSIPAVLVAACGPGPHGGTQFGTIDLAAGP
jgi:uncharacterized membrane protein YfcA